MKKCFIILTLLVLLAGCSSGKHGRVLGDNWTFHINGIDVDHVKDTIKEEPLQAIGGALAAIAVHEISHIVSMKVSGVKDYHFENPFSFTYNTEGISKGSQDWISRAGFVGQLAGGLILTQIPATRESAFTLGYTGASALQTTLYPLPPGDGADLENLPHPWAEYGLYAVGSVFNLYNATKKSDEQLAKEEYAREQEE